ncbi:hemin-degrading factor [Pelagibius sp. Alg239-R121]|uniref:hemin-degrading factor n=1 Tax=Pelagibius sp. Alg239-R121 TaxID=2993448 RepID=UPI0024A71F95|nr:ChuX/HutX family heme-like substrate-binding protein [Pelagibius sp. Alg239-R121]
MTETVVIDEMELSDIDVLELKTRWQVLRATEPQLRARDAAGRLGVSEGELVACRCGEDVRRLVGRWGEIIKSFPNLGQVMVLTRNDHAVHEKVGVFDKISIFKSMGLVLDEDIDLRLFLDHWRSGYAVTEETRSGVRHSLQFFDLDGTAVHKVYLREDSDRQAYEALVAEYLDPNQEPGLEVSALPARQPERPDPEIDPAELRKRWRELQDVHDFHAMLKDLGVGRVQAFRLVGEDFAYRVDPTSFRSALETASSTCTPLMIFTGNPGVIQIHTGPVQKLKAFGPWFNVLDEGFNLHLRMDSIAAAWVIRKPTRDGVVTSLEIFDSRDDQIAWMFGKRKPGELERDDWRSLIAAFEPYGEIV